MLQVARLFFVSLILGAPFAQSASVTFNLRAYLVQGFDPPDKWELWAETSTGDNDGIVGYNVAIMNAESLNHNVMGQGVTSGDETIMVRGFTLTDDTNHIVFAGQNTTNLDSLMYGIGNSGFSVPMPSPPFENVGLPPVGEPFGPVLIASGIGNANELDIGGATANVWRAGEAAVKGTAAESANVAVNISRIIHFDGASVLEPVFDDDSSTPGEALFSNIDTFFSDTLWFQTSLLEGHTRLDVEVLTGGVEAITGSFAAPQDEPVVTIQSRGEMATFDPSTMPPFLFGPSLGSGESFRIHDAVMVATTKAVAFSQATSFS